MYNKELCILFPVFNRDIENPACISDICSFASSEKNKLKYVDDDFYYTKLRVAIHEAGHIVAVLMSPGEEKNVLEAKITCDFKQDITDSDNILYGWYGYISSKRKSFSDNVLNTIVHIAGVEAQKALGIGSFEAYIGSDSDMFEVTDNMLTNAKRVGGVDKSCTWTHQKREYRQLMNQEAETFSLYTKVIMEENVNAIITFAAALYDKEQLSAAEIAEIRSKITINRNAYNNLQKYIKEFYS